MKKLNLKEEQIETYFKSDNINKERVYKQDNLKKDIVSNVETNIETDEYIFKGIMKPGKVLEGEVIDKGFNNKYIGIFIDNFKSGSGEIHYNNGDIYFGTWSNWKKQGKGE